MSLDNLQNKLKIQTKLCMNRLRLVQRKMLATHKLLEKEIVILLEKNMKQNLMVKAENIIRENMKIELLGILDLYCEMLLSRFHLLRKGHCHEQIEQAICTLIYAAPRCEIKELYNMNEIFRLYFGKEFIQNSIENVHGKIDPKVVERLSNEPLNNNVIECYLQEIACLHNIKYYDSCISKNSISSYNKEQEGSFKNKDSSSTFMISCLSDDLKCETKPSLEHLQNDHNDHDLDYINFFESLKKTPENISNNISNINQLRIRFEKLEKN
ncbi:hypothetical protein PORY_000356 [Pneumocystis oryctolagi]|uniref:Uncharacterized protein n=1 Tax=Pneumocystis oryctolagi TaxID=42067 RepID=A0ACB7CGV7_9ASCO|nr:hypothetical protein PORY_000356 [Pneumocystis oryctolagi]